MMDILFVMMRLRSVHFRTCWAP